MFKEFKEFAIKGNMMDLAVGVIIGGAFNALVSSLVNDIIMPLLSLITGKIDFNNLFIVLGERPEGIDTLEKAKEAGLSTINYGSFISGIINFIIMAFVVFLIVKGINRLRRIGEKPAPVEAAEPVTKVCPFCQSEIAIKAVRCPHCTSKLEEA